MNDQTTPAPPSTSGGKHGDVRVTGGPTAEELAAVVLAVASLAPEAASAAPEPERSGMWAHRASAMRLGPLQDHHPQPGWAWRCGHGGTVVG